MLKKDSTLRIAEPKSHKEFVGLTLDSVYRWEEIGSKTEWRCTTGDEYLRVGVALGIVMMSRAEREGDLGKSLSVVLSSAAGRRITFAEIANKMKWKYNENDSWLG